MDRKSQLGIELNTYQLFYVEAIINDSSYPQINRIKPIFENMKKEEFLEIVTKLVHYKDHDALQQFLYFLLIFRDMKHLQEYINSDEFSIELLEQLFIFIYGYCTIQGHSTERVIDEILYFLNDDKLFELLNQSVFISRDKLLQFLILSKFRTETLDRYFSQIEDIPKFINKFLQLPDNMLRSIISRNYHLFQYIMLMLSENKESHEISKEFYDRYKDEMMQFAKLNDIVSKYKKTMNQEKDRQFSFDNRDTARISYLVNMIRELPDPVKAVEYFYGESIFIDEMEKKIVYTIVTDPMFKNTFKYYGTMLNDS